MNSESNTVYKPPVLAPKTFNTDNSSYPERKVLMARLIVETCHTLRALKFDVVTSQSGFNASLRIGKEQMSFQVRFSKCGNFSIEASKLTFSNKDVTAKSEVFLLDLAATVQAFEVWFNHISQNAHSIASPNDLRFALSSAISSSSAYH